MEAGGEEGWGKSLDRLSVCITQQEEAALRQATGNSGSPGHCTDLLNHVAALLVKHGITMWAHLHASFPGVTSLHMIKKCLLLCLGLNFFGAGCCKGCQYLCVSMLRAVAMCGAIAPLF